MITCLPEEILLEVLERTCKYTIDDEVLNEAEKLYEKEIAERSKKKTLLINSMFKSIAFSAKGN
ncbi:hypothetical protein [Clostridium sp. CF012]|uniref:hypothetical protein n=1 Tax=Clostridium sp. CF012 TaxID=2843319 RepID=UPI001C0AE988|nr:hypothetical protein [Clostridium sp. CF012]MBU3142766.1 hypothetical protein [Clostridium sp. CF012]